MRIVVAPDKFKGTLTATEVATAMARGARRVYPDASFNLRPMADGGEGTLEALLTSVGGRVTEVEVSDPLGRPVHAPIGHLDDGRVIVEMASASGLALVSDVPKDPVGATTRGTGELIRQAVEHVPPSSAVVALGGSGTSDGGTGAARAVGWRFLDANGRELAEGAAALANLARIDGDRVIPKLRRWSVVGACDVTNPLLGPEGAAHVYAPQKGASPEDVARIEAGLSNLAERISEDLGMAVSDVPGAGAAGGMGAGLIAFFGAELQPGFDSVAGAVGLEEVIRGADLVITGEGAIDEATLAGKVPAGVGRLARRHGVRCVAVAGEVLVSPGDLRRVGITAARSLVEQVGRREAWEDPATAIASALGWVLAKAEERARARRGRS